MKIKEKECEREKKILSAWSMPLKENNTARTTKRLRYNCKLRIINIASSFSWYFCVCTYILLHKLAKLKCTIIDNITGLANLPSMLLSAITTIV